MHRWERTALEAEVGAIHDGFKAPFSSLPSLDPDRFISYESPQQKKMRIAAGQALRIARARKDVNAFLEYIFTDPKRPEERFEQQWFHREWAKAMLNNDRTIIVAPRDHGKCTRSLTFLETPTGRRYIKGFPGGPVLALDPTTMKMVTAQASPAFESGERDVYRVTTASGRSTVVTDNHPFLRGDEWVECKDLAVGDRVGVMVGCAAHDGLGGDELEAWMLGFILGNGAVTSNASISTTDARCIERIYEYAATRSWSVRPRPDDILLHLSGADTGYGPREWLREYKLLGHSAHTKRVPTQVFRWGKAAIFAFVSGYFDADGGIESRGEQLSFSSVHRDLLADVQALLARCSINGVLAEKRGRYNGKPHLSWRLTLRGGDLRTFREQYTGTSRKTEALLETNTGGYGGGRLDLVPHQVWRKRVTISQRQGRAMGVRFDAIRAISKDKVRRIAEACGSEELRAIADGDVAWEEIVAIESAGREMTYGVEVFGLHSHVTDGIITHNTTQIIGHTLFALGHNPNLRIKIACASDARAKERLYEIVQHIQFNPRVREVFPALEPADTGEWSKHKIIVKRTMPHRDASVEAIGITSSVTGGRADLLIADDVVDRRNALTYPKLRLQVNQSWKSDWINLLEPGARVWYICTLWHKEDLSHEILESDAYHQLLYAIDGRFGSMWPSKWPETALRLRHSEIGSIEFNRAFRNQPTDQETQIVREAWLRYSKLDTTALFTKYREQLQFIISYDTATAVSATSDYSACVILAVDPDGQRAYVVDAWHRRCTIKEQAKLVYEDAKKYNPFRILIEKAGQATLDEWVINDYPELADRIEVTKPRVSKQQRLLACTPLLEGGRIVFNEHLNPDRSAWEPSKEQLINELLDFPFGKHDDLVDAFSQAVHAARRYFLDAWATGGENVIDVRIDGTDHENEDDDDGTPRYLF